MPTIALSGFTRHTWHFAPFFFRQPCYVKNGIGHRADIVILNEHGAAKPQKLGRGARGSSDNRYAACHCFQNEQAEPLCPAGKKPRIT
ncbi:MAG TPA: hypothetical protein PKY01_13280 [Candidatus Hydrogenedentes bacterium]|nr:hypothetical protein [Candidatus Hydrogenedentota bacterium]